MWFVLLGIGALALLSQSAPTDSAGGSDVRLSQNFWLSEFTASATAARLGLDNTPNAEQVENLRALARNVLEPLRASLPRLPDGSRRRLHIVSGYRSRAVNAAVNGADSSDHLTGDASDVRADGMTKTELADHTLTLIQSGVLPVKQAIKYAPGRTGSFHLSHTRTGTNRRETLFAPAGVTTYTTWRA